MPLESSYITKIMVLGTIFGQFDGKSSASLGNKFSMKGRGAAVLVDLKDQKYIIIGLE